MSPDIEKDELTKMINNVFSSKDQLKKEKENLEVEMKKLKAEKAQLDNNIRELNANKENFEKENKDLKNHNRKIGIEMKKLENEKAQFIDQMKKLGKQNSELMKEVDREKVDIENPWTVQSIYEFHFYNCPTCSYRHYSKQEFVNHSFYTHLDSVIGLQDISDGSLSDIICPWDNSNDCHTFDEISNNEFKDNVEIMETILIPNQVEEDNENNINQKCIYCDKSFISSFNLEYHIDQFHDKQIVNTGLKENHTTNENIVTEIDKTNVENLMEIKTDDNSKNDETENHTDDSIIETKDVQNLVNEDFPRLNNLDHDKSISTDGIPRKIEKPIFKYSKCDICSKAFSTEEKLLKHQSIVKNSSYNCKHCCEIFSEYDFLNTHMRKVHGGSDINLKSEQTKNLKRKCPYCGKALRSTLGPGSRGTDHFRKCKKRPKNPTFFCYICLQVFDKNEGLKEHLSIIHSNINHGYDSSKLKDAILPKKESENKNNDKVTDEDDVEKKYLESEKYNDNEQVKDEFSNEKIESLITDDNKKDNQNHKKRENVSESDLKMIAKQDFRDGQIKSESESLNSPDVKKSDEKPEKMYNCKYCDKSFTYKFLNNHIKTAHEVFKCDICKRASFQSKFELKEHKNTFHNCNMCEKTFRYKEEIRMHKYMDHKNDYKGDYKCDYCGKLFFHDKELKKHFLMEHDGHKCKYCKEKFQRFFCTEKELEYHITKHHQCHLCEKILKCKESLTGHIAYVHEKRKDRQCDLCGKSFSGSNNLRKHINDIHKAIKKHECKTCGKKFTQDSKLKNHIHVVHEGIKNYHCTTCGSSFANNCNLKYHVESSHAPKDKLCQMCGSAFRNDEMLKKHVKIVHEGKKDYKCDICGEEFGYLLTLKRHKNKIHFRKHICNSCDKSFSDNAKLLQHIRNVHEGQRNHICEVCGKSFSQQGDRNRHIKKYHKDKSMDLL